MSKSSYFIKVVEARDLRKDILLSAKHSVAILKSKKRINELRSARHDKVNELQSLLTLMHEDIVLLKKTLPKHNRKRLPKTVKEVEKRVEKQIHDQEKALEELQKPATITELTEVSGVGPSRAKKLNKAGIGSAEELSEADPDVIAKKTSISRGTTKNLIREAQKLLRIQSHDFGRPDHSAQKDEDSSGIVENQELDSEIEQLESKLSAIESKLNNL